jgi:gamma-glutamylcysteine synthetase
MKKLFQNYNFEFNKNEKKLISSFCKQALKQMSSDKQFFGEIKAFSSILEKINSGEQTVKLTKDEKTRFTHQLKQNMESIGRQMKKGFFLKRWLMKSLFNQYNNLYENHFKG